LQDAYCPATHCPKSHHANINLLLHTKTAVYRDRNSENG
jgi:hypothetical protein